jgi:hypothetical protein
VKPPLLIDLGNYLMQLCLSLFVASLNLQEGDFPASSCIAHRADEGNDSAVVVFLDFVDYELWGKRF